MPAGVPRTTAQGRATTTATADSTVSLRLM